MYVYLTSFTVKFRTSFQKDVISQLVGPEPHHTLFMPHVMYNSSSTIMALHYITYFLNMFSIYVVK